MKRTPFGRMSCSIARSLDVMGDWWTPLIMRDLFAGLTRFDELVRDLGISRNLLSRRLASLERNGLVSRQAYQRRPLRHAYRLTRAALDLVPVLLALTAWGDRWLAGTRGPPVTLTHRRCKHRFVATVVCSQCAAVVRAPDVALSAGRGGRPGRGVRLFAARLLAAESERV